MPDASYVQSNFLGGEWSPFFQGRFDHPKYRTALKLSRNALPIEEGAHVRRPGTAFCATTRNGAPGRVVSFDIEQVNPFQMEFTDGHLRVFAGNGLVFTDSATVASINTATPAQMVLNSVVTWVTGDQIQFGFTGPSTSATAAVLRNRQFALTKVNSTTFTLADPITGLGVPGSTIVAGSDVTLTAARILDIATPYTSGLWKNLRRVQNESTAMLLQSSVKPQVLALLPTANTNQFAPFTFNPMVFIDGPYLDPVPNSQVTGTGVSGVITITVSWPAWSSIATYALGDIVTLSGTDYQSQADGNFNNNPASSPLFWTAITAGSAVGTSGFQSTDVGRLIRLWSTPPPWDPNVKYLAIGTPVMYQGVAYRSILAQNTPNHLPTDGDWVVDPTATVWTWGKILSVLSAGSVTMQIIGAPLLYQPQVIPIVGGNPQAYPTGQLPISPITTWQLGAYSDTTGWPTCGTFHEGRLWLGGAIPNRFDASMSNGDEFLPGVTNRWAFSPTQPDGTVADNNGITYTFRAPDKNTILWMEPDHAGILCGTIKAEWLIQASALNDPLTPTSIQAHRITKYGCANIEPQRTGLTLVFVQAYQRKLFEFFPDVFTGKFLAPNLSETAMHMVTNGPIEEIRYQREKTPVVWSRTCDGRLLGATYKRETLMSSQPANFIGWHQHTLGSGRLVESISVGPTPDGKSDELMMTTQDPVTGIYHVEAMLPILDQGSALTSAWYVDDAVVPGAFVSSSTGVTLYGLWHLNGAMVSVMIGGLYLGQYTVANGLVTVPFSANPLFNAAFLSDLPVYPPPDPCAPAALLSSPSQGGSSSPPTPVVTTTAFEDVNATFGVQSSGVDMYGNLIFSGGFTQNFNGVSPTGATLFSWSNATLKNAINAFAGSTVCGAIGGPTYFIAPVLNGQYLLAGGIDTSGNNGFYWLVVLQPSATGAPTVLGIVRYNCGFGGGGPSTSVSIAGNQTANDPIIFFEAGGQGVAILQVLPGINDIINGTYNAGYGAGYLPFQVPVAGFTVSGNLARHLYEDPISGLHQQQNERGGFAMPAANGATRFFMYFNSELLATEINDLANPNVELATVLGPTYPGGCVIEIDLGILTFASAAMVGGLAAAPAYTVANSSFVDVNNNQVVPFTDEHHYITGGVAGGYDTYSMQPALIQKQGDGTFLVVFTMAGISDETANNGNAAQQISLRAFYYSPSTGLFKQFAQTTPSPLFTNAQLGLTNTGTVSDPAQYLLYNPSTGTFKVWGFCWSNENLIYLAPGGPGISLSPFLPTPPVLNSNAGVPIFVGFPFTSQGQLVRPNAPQEAGAANGPAFGKKRRSHMFAMLVDGTGVDNGAGIGSDLEVGTSFDHLRPMDFRSDGEQQPLVTALFSGVLWTNIDDTYTFNSELCWQITRPYPVNVMSYGAFLNTQDR